jgi:hypothetical protein
MDIMKLYTRLTETYKTLQAGLEGEFDGYKNTDEQPDARLTEASIKLEDIMNDLLDEITNEAASNSLKIDIGECNMNYESGKLTIPKNEKIDKLDKEHIKWGTKNK